MTRQMSLKMKLTLLILAVMLPVVAGFGILFQLLMSNTYRTLTAALEARAVANVTAAASDISFEMAANQREEVLAKLRAFANAHPEMASLTVLDKAKMPFAEIGKTRSAQELYKGFDGLGRPDSRVQDNMVVAVAPILTDENAAVGYVVYAESLQSFLNQRSRMVTWVVSIFLLGLLVVSTSVYFIGHQTAAPINLLVEAAQRIADGDLKETRLEVSGSAETARLAASVKSMAEALRRQVSAIKELTLEVSAVSGEVASAMTHLASSASEQAAAVAETASTVEEMEKIGKVAAQNASQIAEAAGKTTETSIRGRQAVETTNGIILMIKEDSQTISSKSKNLLSNVEEVGNIISSVNSIAEQSKILAVNASIEAAKAGEYGAGFAVVAQEVKDMAQQSKEATLQITRTLTSIRQAIEDMVSTADKGQRRTEEGVQMVAGAGAIVNDLSEAIRENSELANVISTNVNQQTLGLTQIASAVDQINNTAFENQKISGKIEEITRQMTQAVRHLQNLVDRWKL
ncbi:MAG: methyl-accepting chemotaxis protein [Deltaproteobacteria bacterium]|nr:methyl-accepting chemotaxis protein [Deltaproteobacteria bacterium]